MASQPRVVAERMRVRQPLRSGRRRPLRLELSSELNAADDRNGRRTTDPRVAGVAIRRRISRPPFPVRRNEEVPQSADLLETQPAGFAALVVDDLPIYRHAIRRILQPLADRVFVADDGLEALEQLRRSRAGGVPINIVLTDMHMPVMDGLELISRMRFAGDLTPVVVLTTDPSEDLRVTVERFPHAAVAIKPIDAADLMRMILMMHHRGCNGR